MNAVALAIALEQERNSESERAMRRKSDG